MISVTTYTYYFSLCAIWWHEVVFAANLQQIEKGIIQHDNITLNRSRIRISIKLYWRLIVQLHLKT